MTEFEKIKHHLYAPPCHNNEGHVQTLGASHALWMEWSPLFSSRCRFATRYIPVGCRSSLTPKLSLEVPVSPHSVRSI